MLIEQTVIDWLKADKQLSAFTISTVMPSRNNQRVITVSQTGASLGDVTDEWSLTVDVYAPSRYECAEVMHTALVARVNALWQLNTVAGWQINSIAYYPYVSGEVMRERYTMTLLITTIK